MNTTDKSAALLKIAAQNLIEVAEQVVGEKSKEKSGKGKKDDSECCDCDECDDECPCEGECDKDCVGCPTKPKK